MGGGGGGGSSGLQGGRIQGAQGGRIHGTQGLAWARRLAWCFSKEVIPDLAPSTSMGMKSFRALASLLRDACKPRVEAMPLLSPDNVLVNLCSISWSAIIPMSLHKTWSLLYGEDLPHAHTYRFIQNCHCTCTLSFVQCAHHADKHAL